MRGFRDLRVWQGGMELVESVYRVTQRAQIPGYIYQAAQGTDYGRARRPTSPAGPPQPAASGPAETGTSGPQPEVTPAGETPSPRHGDTLHPLAAAPSTAVTAPSTRLRALVVGMEKSGRGSVQQIE